MHRLCCLLLLLSLSFLLLMPMQSCRPLLPHNTEPTTMPSSLHGAQLKHGSTDVESRIKLEGFAMGGIMPCGGHDDDDCVQVTRSSISSSSTTSKIISSNGGRELEEAHTNTGAAAHPDYVCANSC